MWKAVSALLAAASVAAVLTLMPGLIPGLSGNVIASAAAPFAKGDRYDVAECDRAGWPYYQQDCIRDSSRNAGRATPVRLVTTDRVFVAPSAPLPEWAAYLPALHPASIDLDRTQ